MKTTSNFAEIEAMRLFCYLQSNHLHPFQGHKKRRQTHYKSINKSVIKDDIPRSVPTFDQDDPPHSTADQDIEATREILLANIARTGITHEDLPIILDSGCTISLTPYASDFISTTY